MPVVATFLADAWTPVAAYASLRGAYPHVSLLESVEIGRRWGRYSVVAAGGRVRLTAHVTGHREVDLSVTVPAGADLGLGPAQEALAAVRAVSGALAACPEALARRPDLPRFWGGLVGVFGHAFVRLVEPLPPPRPAARTLAFDLAATDLAVVFDNLAARVHVVAPTSVRLDGHPARAYAAAVTRIEDAVVRLRRSHAALRASALGRLAAAGPLFGARRRVPARNYRRIVETARGHIAAGEVFQVVLAQPFEAPRDGLDALDLYRVLRVTSPAPYMFVVPTSGPTLVGASPEVLVRCEPPARGRTVVVRPIAGTRPRGLTPAEDRALERELLDSPKERAEHTMLVDLARNDVGRVAEAGTVTVTERYAVERYARVMHIVSEVQGILDARCTPLDALCAVFPAGTLSGAPKVRALQIIDELEPFDRGAYGGAVGYLGYDGAADFAIAIRTAEVEDDAVVVRAGAGIVFDSDPAAEDAECCHKASAMLRAVALARGLEGGDESPAKEAVP